MLKRLLLALVLAAPLGADATPLSEPASLRDKLPQDALGYVRVPSLWGLLTAPKGNVLHDALGNEAHEAQVTRLADSIYANLLRNVPGVPGLSLNLLFRHLRSPLEVAVLFPEGAPMPFGLIQAKVDFASAAEVNQFFAEVAASNPMVNVLSPVSGDAFGALTAVDVPVLVQFDPGSGDLMLLAGPTVSAETFTALLDGLAAGQDHPMYALEQQIDESRQGLLVWVNLQRLMPIGQGFIPPPMVADLTKWGLMDVRAAALGLGVSDGKGRLKLVVDAPRAGYRAALPSIDNDLSLTASGEPGTVVGLSLPLLGLLEAFETIAAQEMPPALEQIGQGKEMVKAMTGMSAEQVLASLGPELVFFTDDLGVFMAIGVGDPEGVAQILEVLVQTFGLVHEVREVEGQQIHHLQVPAMALPPELASDPEMAMLFGFLSQLKSHLYWVEEEGYLVFGQVPQALIDRGRHWLRTPLDRWLAVNQGQDVSASLLFASTRIDDTPRHLYYAYLGMLRLAADLAGDRLDLFGLPTALDLGLPERGTYGMQLDLSETSLSLELVFESNPLEFLLAMDLRTVMAVGVGAAIAVPSMTGVAHDDGPPGSGAMPPGDLKLLPPGDTK